MATSKKKSKFQHGSIVRLFLRDFMQYSEVEMKPGPTLNVVIGPNGSGKSSIVNGLALALGAKTAVLGRADDVSEFIRLGKDEAELEVELYNDRDNSGNYVINRQWTKEAKSKTRWTLNKKTSTLKEVTALVKSLNIQTDNLCQFLPQDKVHDFSKMNPKQLLGKTVDAIGENQLKEDHERLKTMQTDVVAYEDQYRMKVNALNDNRKKCDSLEKDVKNLEEKENVESKISLLEKKKEWNSCAEAKRSTKDAADKQKNVEMKIKQEEKSLTPIQNDITKLEKEVEILHNAVKNDQQTFRASMGTAKNKFDRIATIGEEMNRLDEQLNDIFEEENQKKRQIQELSAEIERIKREIDLEDCNDRSEKGASSAEEMAGNLNVLKADLKAIQMEIIRLTSLLSEHKLETKALESKMATINDRKERLQNVDNQKLESLREKLPQGKDAYEAIKWLENNKDKFSGNVYMPIILNLNVTDPSTSIYLENTIGNRDLVAFGTENVDDTNKLLNELRDQMKLRVNVITLPTEDVSKFLPDKTNSTYFTEHQNELDFKGYLSNMFTAPDSIKSYLCKQYALHKVPIFGSKAEAHTQRLVDEFEGIPLFYAGDTRNAIMSSRYGNGQKSTTSNKIISKHWINKSVDKDLILQCENDIKKAKNEHAKIHAVMREHIENQKIFQRKEEAKKKELKELQQKLQYKKVLKGKLGHKMEQLKSLEQEANNVDIEKERTKIKKEKRNRISQCVRLNAELKNLLVEGTELRIKSELAKVRTIPIETTIDSKKRRYAEIDREIDVWRIRLGEEKENVRYKATEYKEALSNAQKLTDPSGRFKGDEPPRDLQRQFQTEGVEGIGSDECRIRIHELEGQLQCIDDVDPGIIRRFKAYKNNVAELEKDIDRMDREMATRRENVTAVRERWLSRLTSLVEQISEKFSEFFSSMGFAGMVQLGKGEHENDFANYGIDILVKFRDNVPLQKLDPFKQSGGERSVSTALYMMALQHLTRVPFRCVDEINQGMDARNERRVFDMLMNTSVKDNTAQYFLLTPKLLPDLQYEDGVTIIIVHNSETMCSYKEWDIEKTIEAQMKKINSK